jgi:hypothetical protein
MDYVRAIPSFYTDKFIWNGNVSRFCIGGPHFEFQVGYLSSGFMSLQENTKIIFIRPRNPSHSYKKFIYCQSINQSINRHYTAYFESLTTQ